MALTEIKAVQSGAQVRDVVTDEGYHSDQTVLELKELEDCGGICRKRIAVGRNWKKKATRSAVQRDALLPGLVSGEVRVLVSGVSRWIST